MEVAPLSIQSIRLWDIPRISRLVFTTMRGVDVDFTAMTSTPLRRALSYVAVPLYLLLGGKGYKAVRRGVTAGCAYYILHPSSGFVFNVAVSAAHRRQGVATSLMSYLEAEVRRAGRRWVGLQVDAGNHPAEKLYERLHYRAYHAHFLQCARPLLPLTREDDTVTLTSLSRPAGGKHFLRQLRKEREAGDAWAAAVIQSDYEEGPPAGGRYWEIAYHGATVGCLWRAQGEREQAFVLLEPAYWAEEPVQGALYTHIVGGQQRPDSALDIHFGSSEHYEAARSYWEARGFTPRRKKRILMLKALGN